MSDHPGAYWDVDLVGSHALLTSYYDSELRIVDVANPSTPSLTSQLRAGKYTFKTVVKGSVAHVLGDWLTTVDVADPENPRILGHLSFESPPSDLVLFDHFGVVSFGAAGLLLLELGDPASLRILRNISYEQSCQGLTAYGSSLFVSHNAAGFSLLDIGLPALYPPPTLTINQAGSSPMISLDALENQLVVLESASNLEGSPAWQKVGQFNYLTAPKSWTPPDTGRTREFFRVKTIR